MVLWALVVAVALATGGKLRKRWSNDDMVVAMQAVEKEELSINAAAAQFKVLCKTLDDRIKCRVQHGTTPGPNTDQTAEEEDALQTCLVHMAQHGFPPTDTMTMLVGHRLPKTACMPCNQFPSA